MIRLTYFVSWYNVRELNEYDNAYGAWTQILIFGIGYNSIVSALALWGRATWALK
jgi:hypothetical protein